MEQALNSGPVWAPAKVVRVMFGLGRARLAQLHEQGLVRARKLDPQARSSAVVYRVDDIGDWLENQAPEPGARRFEARRGKGSEA